MQKKNTLYIEQYENYGAFFDRVALFKKNNTLFPLAPRSIVGFAVLKIRRDAHN